jgi:hypothetical protein
MGGNIVKLNLNIWAIHSVKWNVYGRKYYWIKLKYLSNSARKLKNYRIHFILKYSLHFILKLQELFFTFYFRTTNEFPRFILLFKMTNEKNSYIQFFPVNFTESQTDDRPTFGGKKYTECHHQECHLTVNSYITHDTRLRFILN